MMGPIRLRQEALLHEIGTLGEAVAVASREIAALNLDKVTARYTPGATDGLDAIALPTATATKSTLEACETLDAIGTTLRGKAAQERQDATTKICESCGFQDIAVQCITKVISALKTIEVMVARVVLTFGKTTTEPQQKLLVPFSGSLLDGL